MMKREHCFVLRHRFGLQVALIREHNARELCVSAGGAKRIVPLIKFYWSQTLCSWAELSHSAGLKVQRGNVCVEVCSLTARRVGRVSSFPKSWVRTTQCRGVCVRMCPVHIHSTLGCWSRKRCLCP